MDKKFNIIPRLKRKGFDGIKFYDTSDGITWAVFKPEQIKIINIDRK
jgi:hypothetical protein